jgi:cytoskeletal protein CcmA (bactofilin family)
MGIAGAPARPGFAVQPRPQQNTRTAEPAAPQAPESEPAVVPQPPEALAPAVPAPSAPKPKASGGAARLIVGPDIKLKGAEITDCDTLIVEGQVEASMVSRVIEVDELGVFRGNVQVEIADIRGRFEGELVARKQLVVRASGRIAGKIRYAKIQIDEGGELCGDVATAESVPNPSSAATERGTERTAQSSLQPAPEGMRIAPAIPGAR